MVYLRRNLLGERCISLNWRHRGLSTKVQGEIRRLAARACLATLAGILLVSAGIAGPDRLTRDEEKTDTAIQGKLLVQAGKAPVLRCPDGEISLGSDRRSIAETLRDSRLSGRELKVVGQFKGDGGFEVHEFFIVRPDGLYRLLYHCDVCNITTFSPGDCLCCQAPTVPVEVLPTDPRIYHEEIQGPPRPKSPE